MPRRLRRAAATAMLPIAVLLALAGCGGSPDVTASPVETPSSVNTVPATSTPVETPSEEPSSSPSAGQIDFAKQNEGKTPDDNGYLLPPNGKIGRTNLRNVKYAEADQKYDPDACLDIRAHMGTPDFPENTNPYACAPAVPFKADYYMKRSEGGGWSTHQVAFAFDQCTPNFCQVVSWWAGELEVYDDDDWMLITSVQDAAGYSVDLPIYVDEATYKSLPDSGTYTMTDREQFIDWYDFHSDDFEENSQGD